jgi:two-component system OmpR family response regulator
MLQCNMINSLTLNIQLALEDLLANLHFARKHDQLGRLALLAYCEVKGWARLASKPDLADKTIRMFSESPCATKGEFFQNVDSLIATLEFYEQAYRINNTKHFNKETTMRILVAEDDQVMADGLLRSLRSAGAIVEHVASGSEADAVLRTYTEFDLLILDLSLPKMHGLEVLKKLRARGSSMPVLILTAADSVEERIKGLDCGADDYMTKPFSLQELEARVRTLVRRSMGASSSRIKFGPLTYDLASRMVTINDKLVELTASELGLLEVLLQRVKRLVTKVQLVDRLCQWGEEVSVNAIEVYIHRLRKKIEMGPIRIITVRGLGYCLANNFE